MSSTFFDILISWFPVLLLIGVWIYFMRRGGFGGQAEAQKRFLADQLAELRRQNETLERIAAALERR